MHIYTGVIAFASTGGKPRAKAFSIEARDEEEGARKFLKGVGFSIRDLKEAGVSTWTELLESLNRTEGVEYSLTEEI